MSHATVMPFHRTMPTIPRPRALIDRVTTCIWPARRFVSVDGLMPLPPGATWACPAPTSKRQKCLRELPCTSHGVRSPHVGMMLHGHMLAQVPDGFKIDPTEGVSKRRKGFGER